MQPVFMVRNMPKDAAGRGAITAISLFLLLLAGCSSLPTDYPRTHSQALEAPEQTKAGAKLARLSEQHP